METGIKEGKYIYCIIESSQFQSFGPLGIGGRGDELYTICSNGIAAVVSNSPVINYSISRDNVLPHEKAIEEVMKDYAVLPVRFATIAEDEERVKIILEKEHDKFINLLKDMKDKKELGIKAIFREEVIYKEILENHQDIRALKERIVSLPAEKTYYQRMAIGKLVEQALQDEKALCKEDILAALSPLAVEIKINNNYGERMILNTAFLVKKHNESAFDGKVGDLGEKYDYKIKFKYVGPLPPFNFVNIVIETRKY